MPVVGISIGSILDQWIVVVGYVYGKESRVPTLGNGNARHDLETGCEVKPPKQPLSPW